MKLFKNLTAILACFILFSCSYLKKDEPNSQDKENNASQKVSSTEDTSEGKQTQLDPNKKPEFDISFPDSWKIEKGLMGTEVSAISPIKDEQRNFHANLNVVTETVPTKMDLDTYFEASKRGLTTMLKGATLINEGDFNMNGSKAKYVTITHTHMGYPLKAKAYITLHGGKYAFVVTGTSTVEGFDKFESDFDQSARSFTLK